MELMDRLSISAPGWDRKKNFNNAVIMFLNFPSISINELPGGIADSLPEDHCFFGSGSGGISSKSASWIFVNGLDGLPACGGKSGIGGSGLLLVRIDETN